MITNTAKLQDKVMALTNVDGSGGVNILTESGEFRSTYDILLDIAEVWDRINETDPKNQAALLEILAGKTRGSQLAAILQNPKDLKDAYEMALSSEGSALQENEKYLDSIQGRIDLLTNSVQTMWMNFINSDVLKFLIDIARYVIELVDNVGVLSTALLGTFGVFAVQSHANANEFSFFGALTDIIPKIPQFVSGIGEAIKQSNGFSDAISNVLANMGLLDMGFGKIAVSLVGFGSRLVEAAIGAYTHSTANGVLAKSYAALGAVATSVNRILADNPSLWIPIAIIGVTALVGVFNWLSKTTERHAEQLKKTKQAYQEVASEIRQLEDELDTVKKRIEELNSMDKLSFTEEEELRHLQAQNAELERQIQLKKILWEEDKKEQNADFVKTMKSSTSSMVVQDSGDVITKQHDTYIQLAGYEDAKKRKQEAEEELIRAQESGDKKAAKSAQKRIEAAEKDMATHYDTLKGYYDEWSEYATGIDYIENPTTESEKAVNQWLDFYNDFADKLAIVMDTSGKSTVNAFNRVSEKQQHKNILAELTGNKELSGQALSDMLSVEPSGELNAFIQDLVRCGFIADTTAESLQRVADTITKTGNFTPQTDIEGVVYKTYSTMLTQVEAYNEVLKQTDEIVLDNTKVTQEYIDALEGLGLTESELSEYFDDNNKLVVKNAKGLKNLIKSTAKETVSNAKLAKSQAKLQYYKLYKQLRQLTNGTKISDKATLAKINSLYEEMSAVQKVISKYSMLEAKLLGSANAYDKLAEAQAMDEAIDYGTKAEEMVNVLANAFNTGKLGTEAAQVAIAGLIPDDIIDKSKTLDEQMAQIYKYFTTGTMSKLFTIEFDDEGGITGVDMTKENVEKFTKELINAGEVFTGTWDEFELNPDITSLDDFADKIGVTKEVAFAFLTELETYDINWLGGNYETLLDQLMGDDFEYQAYSNIQKLAELEMQLVNGAISVDEYTKKYKELTEAQAENNAKITENANAWSKNTNELSAARDEVIAATKDLGDMHRLGASDYEIEIGQKRLDEATVKLEKIITEREKLHEPTVMEIEIALDTAQSKIEEFKENNKVLLTKVAFEHDEEGNYSYTIDPTVEPLTNEDLANLDTYKGLLEEEYRITVLGDENPDDATAELESVQTAAEAAKQAVEDISKAKPTVDCSAAMTSVQSLINKIAEVKGKTVYINTVYSSSGVPGLVNGTAHAKGTAFKSGDWGLPKAERNALVGELGEELVVDPNSGRYYTVGTNGAEMVDLPKDAIVFNHIQTEQLLKNGHVTGRGKAYASGNAYAGINTWMGGYNNLHKDYVNAKFEDTSDKLSDAADDISDAADEFKEVFDWVEVRLTEIEEQLDLLNAQLENAVGYLAKNQIIDATIQVNDTKLSNLKAGLAEYEEYAAKLLTAVPSQYRDAVQNGAIAIENFEGEADEKTLEAINDYREWAEKAADLKQQIEELEQKIADLVQQKFDNIANDFDNITNLIELSSDKLDAQISLMEDRGYVAAKEYYESMAVNTKKINTELVKERDLLQATLDEQVKLGHIKVGSDAWYEMVEQLYDVDAAIVECEGDLESFQNAINDIYWDNFDELINRFGYLSDETQNLIDLMDEADMVFTPDDENGWSADKVTWTDEGLASLGLYAQQMEISEYQAKQYAEAIKDLNKDYQDGKYSESEYLEKLNELKGAQYDSIEAYYEAQDAIKELNEARVDSIKEGIEKEIEAYKKLIETKKEELDAEKDMYDFQKSVMEQQKSVADIERKLAALAGDNSISAAAKRKQLEAELAEAQYELEETYYDRSVEDKQTALDKELESFEEEKNKEIEKWEEYLTNIEQVVADSLGIVQANASGIYDTLGAKAEEYNLTLSNAIMTPWQDGALAISDYQTVFDTAISSTTDQLEKLKLAWQDVINVMSDKAEVEIATQQKENDRYVTPSQTSTKPATNKPASINKATPALGQTVQVKKSATHFSKQSGNAKMASFVPGGTYEVMQVGINGDTSQILIGKNGQYTGWVRLTDLEGYAKGTKGVSSDQFAWIDELGEELVMHADGSGKLSFLTKGSSVIPADITKNLMQLGQLNPQDILDRAKPVISAPHIINNNIELNLNVGEIVRIEHVDNNTIPDLTKAIEKQMDKYVKGMNAQIRKYSR